MTLYAAYGSNLHPYRLRQRVPSVELVTTARLSQWSLRFHKRGRDGSGKCSIARGGRGIWLAVYRIGTADKQRLDGIEGLGRGYEELSLDLRDIGRCYTYVAAQDYVDDGLSPFSWYRDLVALGCRFHGFPEDYVAAVAAVATTVDRDAGRHRENALLAKRLRRLGRRQRFAQQRD